MKLIKVIIIRFSAKKASVSCWINKSTIAMKVNVLVQKVKMRFEITYDYDLSTTLKVGLEL